jgi:hypothetical protein
MSPFGSVIPLPNTQLIMQDFAGDLRRVVNLIRFLETADESLVEHAHKCVYVPASKIESLLKAIYVEPPEANDLSELARQAKERVVIRADAGAGAVYVKGWPEVIERLKKEVRKLDQPAAVPPTMRSLPATACPSRVVRVMPRNIAHRSAPVIRINAIAPRICRR